MGKKRKRGDVGENGMVFYRYQASSKNGEYWMTPEQYAVRTQQDQGIQINAQKRYRGDSVIRERRNAYMREWRCKNGRP